ncbi:uncharacterized protein LOC122078769 isoform X2 [Macadamia integrifolia]|uniref:uncharacterized protein LOC122078769 isoform X2 n=1 Tax=Macadamia integrifolia TaxID=60698 RepID=UPI001C4F509C|nr:uncharacterized protein LOC122078769 isoform X2 [Macadamia integrifolia]
MMVASSFDLWQKDAFFSAAEEVQESTDIMESVYRTWLRERREGTGPEDSEELRRELQITLGTAKWQLEEFERAVRLSYGNRSEHNTSARHKQFIVAIEDQISRVEKALRESMYGEGKQPMRWVNLDEEERDDLASFLSRTPGTLKGTKVENVELRPSTNNSLQEGNQQRRKVRDFHIDAACRIDIPDCVKDNKEVVSFRQDANYAVELETKNHPGTKDDLSCQVEKSNGHRRTWSTPSFAAWKIVIADEDEQRKTLVASDESTIKEKGFKNSFRKQKSGEHLRAKEGISTCLELKRFNLLYQVCGRLGGSQRQIQGPQRMQFSSLKLTLVAVLTIFLIGFMQGPQS